MAQAAVYILKNLDAILNRPVFISGVRNSTQNNILAALEAEFGMKFEVEHIDVKEFKEKAMKALEEGHSRQAVRGLTMNSQFNEEDGYADFLGQSGERICGG